MQKGERRGVYIYIVKREGGASKSGMNIGRGCYLSRHKAVITFSLLYRKPSNPLLTSLFLYVYRVLSRAALALGRVIDIRIYRVVMTTHPRLPRPHVNMADGCEVKPGSRRKRRKFKRRDGELYVYKTVKRAEGTRGLNCDNIGYSHGQSIVCMCVYLMYMRGCI